MPGPRKLLRNISSVAHLIFLSSCCCHCFCAFSCFYINSYGVCIMRNVSLILRMHDITSCSKLPFAVINVPSNFLKSVCAQNFLCATFYQHSYYLERHALNNVQNKFFKENSCALQVFLCALISRPVCACTRAQLRGNIGCDYWFSIYPVFFYYFLLIRVVSY